MRMFVDFLFVVIIGLIIGGFSANYSIQRTHGFGAINIGQWSAWPFVGGSEIDPYTAAKAAADRTIPLGAAEGLAFEARTDNEENELLLECSYRIGGNTPPARMWTVAAYDLAGDIITSQNTRKAAIHSNRLVRFPDGSFVIEIGTSPRSGNWIASEGKGAFKLVLRLYDTPITSNAGLLDPKMPLIEKLGCGQ